MSFAKWNLLGDTNHAERHSCLSLSAKAPRWQALHKFTHKKADKGTYVPYKQKKAKHRRRTHKNLSNIYSHGWASTHKRVWNESRARCTVGRLLTHAWTLTSRTAPVLRDGQRSSWGWLKTISFCHLLSQKCGSQEFQLWLSGEINLSSMRKTLCSDFQSADGCMWQLRFPSNIRMEKKGPDLSDCGRQKGAKTDKLRNKASAKLQLTSF